ncbi:MAG: hypothetical protein IIA14_05275 [SAR324 cluster bacterium]|nr:hypothetical protein [SAR324 cluster bacterium]
MKNLRIPSRVTGRISAKFSAFLAWGLLLVAAAAPAYAQAEKPDAALTPVAALGDISEVEKAIIFNGLQSSLTKFYKLVSQEDYARAEEAAFAELELEQCTEEQCIRKIQELLQVERLFNLQILRQQQLTQLSLTLVREADRIVRNDTCVDCGAIDLFKRVQLLVVAVTEADRGEEAPPQELRADLPKGYLTVAEAPADSTVTLSGGLGRSVQLQKTLPLRREPLTIGAYNLTVTLPDGETRQYREVIKEDQENQVSVAETFIAEKRDSRRFWAWWLFGGSVAFLAANKNFQDSADRLAAERNRIQKLFEKFKQPHLLQLRDETDQKFRSDQERADASLLFASGTLAWGLWIYFIDPDPGFEPVSLTPPPDGSGEGLALAYTKRW